MVHISFRHAAALCAALAVFFGFATSFAAQLADTIQPAQLDERLLARAIVEAWMDSPGHRENIVNAKLRFFGCAAKMSQSQDGIAMIFAVQAFYPPKKSTR